MLLRAGMAVCLRGPVNSTLGVVTITMTTASDGKRLEALVSLVESRLVPPGFEVKANQRVFDDDGNQIAEFDIEVVGMIGTTSIAWLIECRDRPAQGAAPGSWIEQLVGRRTRFQFSKVTAVSTTGFAPGAIKFAEEQGIELREVRSLDPDEFAQWLHIRSITYTNRKAKLRHCTIVLHPNQPEPHLRLAESMLSQLAEPRAPFLVSSSSGAHLGANDAFLAAVQAAHEHFDHLAADCPHEVHLIADYEDVDHFTINTALGSVRVQQLRFDGNVTIERSIIPLISSVEYRDHGTKSPISQVASFEARPMGGVTVSLEFHKLSKTGAIHVVARPVKDDA